MKFKPIILLIFFFHSIDLILSLHLWGTKCFKETNIVAQVVYDISGPYGLVLYKLSLTSFAASVIYLCRKINPQLSMFASFAWIFGGAYASFSLLYVFLISYFNFLA